MLSNSYDKARYQKKLRGTLLNLRTYTWYAERGSMALSVGTGGGGHLYRALDSTDA
jgi:hypothetical protein